MSERKYKDENGEEVTLIELCRRDPAWAASRIFWMEVHASDKERERVLGLIQYAREEGETDMRQLRSWVEDGDTADEMSGEAE